MINTIFLDIGNVILTNGWDRYSRDKAIELFKLDREEVNERHALMFNMYEEGHLTLDQYLDYVIFYEPRTFSKDDFKKFMFDQSKPLKKMLVLISELKKKYHLKVVALSNEGQELMLYRIKKFKLKEIIDFFICSCFVHMRKPNPSIYHMALDLVQEDPKNVVYIDDRPLLIEMGKQFGLKAIYHTDYDKTKKILTKLFK